MRALLIALCCILLALPAWAGTAVISSAKGANVYDGPSKRAKKKDKLAQRAEVETFEEREGRTRVRYSGGEGWVSAKTLRMVQPKAPRPVSAQPSAESSAPSVAPVSPGAAVAQSLAQQAALPAAPPAPVAPVEKQSAEAGYLSEALKEEPSTKVGAGPGLLTVIGSLLVVLALVAGGVYLVKILSGRRYLGTPRGKGIQILASRPLGPRQALLLVEVGGVPLLLAQSEGMVNLITEIRDAEAVARLNEAYGFRETPFETSLRSHLDLEREEGAQRRRSAGRPPQDEDKQEGLSAEDRLAALRRRRRPGEDT